MLKKYKIVHISQTPLVAAPSKIAYAQRLAGHSSIAIALKDYPASLQGKFIDDFIIEDDFTKPIIEMAIKNADIIHIHNDISHEWANRLLESNQRAKYVYQVHSPLREGPLYVPRHESISLPFSVKLVVGQFQPRIHVDHIVVPNVFLDIPSIEPRKPGEKLRVMFSPTHKRPGRWNNKHTNELDKAINALVSLNKIETVMPDNPVSPKILMSARRTCHVSIDEIATGGFHQVSVESLAAGNISINKADYFSKKVFSNFSSGVLPPFVYADASTISDVLTRLSDDVEETARLQKISYEYFKNHLTPLKMAKIFDDAYESVQ